LCCYVFSTSYNQVGKKKKKKKKSIYLSFSLFLSVTTAERRWRHQPVTNLGNELIALRNTFLFFFFFLFFLLLKGGRVDWEPVATTTTFSVPVVVVVVCRKFHECWAQEKRESETPERLLILRFSSPSPCPHFSAVLFLNR
jgi:hypothetical protein